MMKHVLTRWGAGLAAVAAMTLAAPRARAAAHTYNTKVQTIRVGVLLANHDAWSSSNSTGVGSPHLFSYVFQALNARADVRPYSWDVVNPHASPFLDDASARRYGITFDPSNPPRLNKNMGAYWEVFLKDASTEQLSDYDVLYMPFPLNDANTSNALTVADREKLRRAVDGGTILWVDNVGGTGGPTFPGGVGGKIIVDPTFAPLPGTANQNGDPMQSLLNTPNPLSQREIRSIGTRSGRSRISGANVDGNNGFAGWQQVLFVGNSATAAVFGYGQGAIVVTGGRIGAQLTEGFRQGDTQTQITSQRPGWLSGNTGAVSGSDARFVSSASLKFMVNIISYGFQNSQTGGGPRHASGSRQDLNTPLGRKWQYPENFSFNPGGFKYAGVKFVSDPVVWNGIAYAATSDGKLRAFDMDPYRDLDGDGNPDDGQPDTANPSSDIIWEAPLPAPCSSLTVGTVANQTYIYGMLSNGSIFRVNGLTWGMVNGRRRILPTANPSSYPVFKGQYQQILKSLNPNLVPGESDVYRIPAPVWYDGRLFAAGMQASPSANTGYGSVAEIDPASMQVKWQFPETMGSVNISPQSRMGMPSATPTVAAIPDKGYADATDIMLLVPTLSIGPSAGLGQTQASRVVAFPLGVRGERMLYRAGDNGLDRYYTRFVNQNAISVDPNTVVLWAPTPPGNQTRVTGFSVNVDPQHLNRVYFSGPSIGTGIQDDVRADYDFAPSPPAGAFAGYGARWSFDAWSYVQNNVAQYMEILTSPVVSNDGSIYWVASDLGQGGGQAPSIMGVEMREQKTNFNTDTNINALAQLNRPQLSFIYSIGQGQTLSGQNPPVTLGTPAVDRGILYVPWGQWDGTQSKGGVAGYHVQGTQFGLLLAQPVDDQKSGSVAVFQRDRFTGDFKPVSFGLIQVQNVSVNDTLHGLILFKALSAGSGQASLDLSRPGDIQVSYPALDPSTAQSTQITGETPQVYYKVGSQAGSDPNILMAYNSVVPSYTSRGGIRTGVTVAGGSIYVGTDEGEIWTVPLPTDLENISRIGAGPAPVYMRPATFPSLAVSAGFNNQGGSPYPVDPGAALRATPVVANNTLVVNAPVGLYTFYSPRTLITDSNRILEVVSAYAPGVDLNGDPTVTRIGGLAGSAAVWSLDSTSQTRDFGQPGAGRNAPPWGEGILAKPIDKPLNQPTMAVRVNTTNTLICDTGNNRVVEVDRAGRVVWQLTNFADPYGLLSPNESRSLASPTSVQRWETFDYDPQDHVGARVQHTLVADFGNNRVLEIVSRYSADPDKWANNVLVWAGKGPEGSAYHFYQAQREPYFNPKDPENDGSLDYGRTIASVTNLSVNTADAQLPDPDYANAITNKPATPGGSIVILGARSDVDGAGKSASGKVVYFFNRMQYSNDKTRTFPLARPVYFNRYTTGDGANAWVLTMTDGQNVFDVTPSGTPGLALVPVTDTDFPIIANAPIGSSVGGGIGSGGYTIGTAMAKRLQNGDILMVNQQTGYVFEFSPTAAQAKAPASSVLQITAPPIQGTGSLSRPVYADRLF
jgi:hypothetical protein